MRQSEWKRQHETRLRKGAQLQRVEDALDGAIAAARTKWTGLVGQVNVWADPTVRRLRKTRDHLLRDLGKIAKRNARRG